jgi:SulP family sulfate permease
MRRMSEVSGTKLSQERHLGLADPKMAGVVVYEIARPLFFGAAEKAVSTLAPVAGTARVVILEMSAVPVMDMTGLVALESAIAKLQKKGTFVVLAGVQRQPQSILSRAGLGEEPGRLAVCDSHAEALLVARTYVGLTEEPSPPAAVA